MPPANVPTPEQAKPPAMPPMQVPGYPNGAPQLHGIKKVLSTVGSILPWTQPIMPRIPGTPENYQMQEQGANRRFNEDAIRTQRTQENTQRQQAIEEEPGKVDLNKRNVESEIGARGDKDTSALAKLGLARDKDGNVVADEASPVFKQNKEKETRANQTAEGLNAYRQSMVDLNGAKEEVERAKNDPNSPAYQAAQQKLMMAQRAHDIAAQNLGLHQQEFQNKLQEQDLVKPGGQAQSRGSAAQAALDVLPGLAALVKKNGSSMGVMFGRINQGRVKLGDVNPEVAKLYGAMKSFYALQPAIHGFRNAEFVKDFETAIGTLERDPNAFLAGMEGLKPTMEAVAKEGKTFHHRIVEGQEGQQPNGRATPKGGGFAAWDKANPQ